MNSLGRVRKKNFDQFDQFDCPHADSLYVNLVVCFGSQTDTAEPIERFCFAHLILT